MESALDYYGYTDRTPAAWHLAVDNKSTRTRFYIDYPIVKPHFIRSNRYQVGIEEAEIDGKPVKIYDRERTICDLLLHRNKVDGEVFNMTIQRYVQDPKKAEARLLKYAKLLHVEKKLGRYLEYGYKEHGCIGTDRLKESVKRRRNSISDGPTAFCTGRISEETITFSVCR